MVVWDEPKRELNLRQHGLDFADYATAFDRATALEFPKRASVTGCRRNVLVGWWDGRLVVVVVVSPLGSEALSLLSIRPADQKECDLYDRR